MAQARDPALDQFKGILICLIVLGHNYFFSEYFPQLFSFIYGFHVISFLLLPFLFIRSSASEISVEQGRRSIGDRLLRILVPHLWFVFLAAAAYAVFYVLMGDQALGPWIKDLLVALVLQRETLFRETVGSGLFWFLPAYAVQAVLLWQYVRSSDRTKLIIFLIALIWHVAFGAIGFLSEKPLPWSLSLVSYLFFLGLLINKIHQSVVWSRTRSWAMVAIWLVCSVAAIKFQFFHTMAGDIKNPVSILNPLELVLQDGLIIVSFFALLRFSFLIKFPLLERLGKYSLQIFLIHSFVWQVLWRGFLHNIDGTNPITSLAMIVLSFSVTLAITYGLARLLERTPLQSILFPRSFSDLRVRNA